MRGGRRPGADVGDWTADHFGECPEWALDILAAKELGCSIIELDELPFYWRDRALVLRSALNWAENEAAAGRS